MKKWLAGVSVALVLAGAGAFAACGDEGGVEPVQTAQANPSQPVYAYDSAVKKATVILCGEIGKEVEDDTHKFDEIGRDMLGAYGYLVALYWDFCMQTDTSKPGTPPDDAPTDGDG